MPIFAELVYSIYKRDNPLNVDAWTLMRRQVIVSMDKVIFLALVTCLVGYSLVSSFGGSAGFVWCTGYCQRTSFLNGRGHSFNRLQPGNIIWAGLLTSCRLRYS
jgi:hypothetical protein